MLDVNKMIYLTGWRRSIAVYHVMESTAEELGITKEAALEILGVTSKRVATRTASNIKNLIEFFGSEQALEEAFQRLEPYAQTPQKLWYTIVTLAKNNVKNPCLFGGKFTELEGIGPQYAAILNKLRNDFIKGETGLVHVHIRIPKCLRTRYKEMAKEDGVTMGLLMKQALLAYAKDRPKK